MKLRLSKSKILFVFSFFILGTSVSTIQAQKKKSKEKTNTLKTIKDITKKSKKIEGLFTMYQDTVTGKTHMLITKNQIDKEFIYFSQITDGISDVGRIVRGTYLSSKIFTLEKHFNKIELITQNTSFYFDPKSALSKSSEANISEGILASLKIVAENEKKGLYLIASDDLFLKETFEQIKPANNPKSSPLDFKLGKLNEESTKINSIKNYPQNTSINSHYVYSNDAIINRGSEALSDSRNITTKVEHSLIALPKNNYKPRLDDSRIGYFLTKVTNQTSSSPTPYRDLIHRWNLVKKDTIAPISEPIEPIVWWIENTTPIEFRETIKDAVLEWNKAFEKAGFKNAIVVKTQPDDAKWEAGDIRYNVLRWTSSPSPRFGGYGPSFVNPRTGQIMGADIMLEYVHHTNRIKYDRVFNMASNSHQSNQFTNFNNNTHAFCSYGHEMQENMLFGQAALLANNANENEMKGMRMEAMKELVMHEVGHTLGLNHNMKASQLFSPKELNTPSFIKDKCLTGSVMDYTAINIALDKKNQGHYYSTTVGPYDEWAIEYGYTQVSSNNTLSDISNKSTQPELAFGNDADDMRSPGKAIDPRVMIGDMSNDQITYSIDRIKLVEKMMPQIKAQFNKEGQSYQELRQAFEILRSQHGQACEAISRFIGGVYVDRSMIGQDENKKPYTPVKYEDQKRAMEALDKYVFDSEAYNVPKDLYNYLAMQRRGFNFFEENEDPKIHNIILSYQTRILEHLLHPNTLQRISDSELYGNNYKLSEFMTDLNNSIFKKDALTSSNTFRQNLQLEYTKKLIAVIKPTTNKNKKTTKYSNIAKTIALYNLNEITKMMQNINGDLQTKAHKNYLNTLIKNTIDDIK